MKLLLDTHTALWLFNEHEKLSPIARDYLLEESNALYISIVSAWEVAIKTSLGKLGNLKGGVKIFLHAIDSHPIEVLPISAQYLELVEALPFIHRDPFDRLIIATAISENMSIITTDENIQKYNVSVVW